jgi:hypothetical protein
MLLSSKYSDSLKLLQIKLSAITVSTRILLNQLYDAPVFSLAFKIENSTASLFKLRSLITQLALIYFKKKRIFLPVCR